MDLHSSAGDARNVTAEDRDTVRTDSRPAPDSTPLLDWEQEDGRDDPRQRFALYRLCECETCNGRGKWKNYDGPGHTLQTIKCPACRGEGRTLQLLATCESAEAAGVALVTLAREGEWSECPLGLLDRMGEKGQKWLVLPWLPSPRNVSDAGRTLRGARK